MKGLGALALLLVVALGLGAALWFGGDDGEPAEGLQSPALDGRDVWSAHRISIRSAPQKPTIVLQRIAPDRFEIVEPLRDFASQAFLQSLAGIYDTALLTPAFLPEEIDDELLRQAGLAPAQAAIEFAFDDRTLTLELGLPGPLGVDLFVRRDGRIWRGKDSLMSAVQGNVDDLRERVLFMHEHDDVQGLVIRRQSENGVETLRFEQRGTGQWRLTEPIDARADAVAVRDLLAITLGMRVGQFLGGNVAESRAPQLTIEVVGRLGTERVDLWNEPTLHGVHVQRELAFLLDAAEWHRIYEAPVLALRSRFLMPAPAQDLVRIKITPPNGDVLRFDRSGGGEFRLAEPVAVDADPTAVNELLRGLQGLYVAAFVEGEARPEHGFATATSLEVVAPLAPGPVVVQLGADAADGQTTFAKRADEPYVVQVPKEAADAVRRAWPLYASKQALRLTPAFVRRIEVVAGERRTLYVRGNDGRWRRDAEEETRDIVGDTVEMLCSLRAARALDPREVAALPEAREIVLMRENGDALERLTVWPRGDTAVVQLRSRPGIAYELIRREGQELLGL